MAAPKPPSLDSATSAASAAASAATSAISSAIPSGADIGQFIREQRQHARLSLRRLAEDTGVSNPYLSQIERGLRKPSAEILQQLAKGLRISAEQLYVQAGLLEDRGTSQAVEAAIVSDVAISERQKRVLLDIYASFLTENHSAGEVAHDGAASAPKAARRPAKRSAKKAARAAKKPAKQTASTSSPSRKKSVSAPKSSTSSPTRKASSRKASTSKAGTSKARTSKAAKTSTSSRKTSQKKSTSTSATARSTS
jgi:transcriptional regulator with XRE-family HTH domain